MVLSASLRGQPLPSGSLVLKLAMGLGVKMTQWPGRPGTGHGTTMDCERPGNSDWHGPAALETNGVPRPRSPWKWQTEPSWQQGGPSPLCFLLGGSPEKSWFAKARPGQRGRTRAEDGLAERTPTRRPGLAPLLSLCFSPQAGSLWGSLQVPAVPALHPTEVMMTTGKDDFRGWCCRQPGVDTSRGQGTWARVAARNRPPQRTRGLQASGRACSQAQSTAFSKPSSLGARDKASLCPQSEPCHSGTNFRKGNLHSPRFPGHRRTERADYDDRAFQLQDWGTQTCLQ